jgi:hypothetical protein
MQLGMESLQQDDNDNGVRIINSATSKYLLRAQCSNMETSINTLGSLLI